MRKQILASTLPFLLICQMTTPAFAELSGTVETEDEQISTEEEVNLPSTLTVDQSAVFEEIGPQVYHGTALVSAFGTLSTGEQYMYVLQHGTPSALTVVNLTTNVTEGSYVLGQSTSAWGIDVDKDGSVWVGGTSDGHLYKYNPYEKVLEDLGNQLTHPKDSAIQDLHIGGGRVYASTAYNGTILSYIPETGEKRDYGQFLAGKEFAKSVYFDEELESIFAGVGSRAELLKYDIRTKIRTRFLPKEYRNERYISDIKVIDNYLFARLDPSAKMLVFDKHTLALVDEFDITSKTISDRSTQTNSVYYTNKGNLYRYQLDTQTSEEIALPSLKREIISADIMNLGQDALPGDSVVGLVSNAGDYFVYNLETGTLTWNKVALAELPVTLYTMNTNQAKDKVLVNGYMSGGIGFYDTVTGETKQLKGVSQVESMSFLGDTLYLGAYPKSRLLELQLTDDIESIKVKDIYRYSDFGQARTTALIGVEEHNKLVIGTYPETSNVGGVLSIYDPVLKTFDNYQDYIKNQSIISLQYLNGYVYGGTTAFANHKRSENPATFFRFPLEDPTKVEAIETPFSPTMVNALTPWKEEYVFGVADGQLFRYHIETGDYKKVMITTAISGRFKNANLSFAPDGMLYGTVEGVLFKVDPETLNTTILKEKEAHDLAIDINGVVYFRNQAKLWKYDPRQQQ